MLQQSENRDINEIYKSIFCPLPRFCGWYGYLEDCVSHIKRVHFNVSNELKYVSVIHRKSNTVTFQINAGLRLKNSNSYTQSLFIPWVAMMTCSGHSFIFHCTYEKYGETYYIGIRIIGSEEQAKGFIYSLEICGSSFIRNYGPFPVTNIARGSYNETDFMSITAKDIETLYQANLKPGLIRAFRLTGKLLTANDVEYQQAVENFQVKTNFKQIKRKKKKRSKVIVDKDDSVDQPPPKQPCEPSDPLSLITSSSARCFALPSFHSIFHPIRSTNQEPKNNDGCKN